MGRALGGIDVGACYACGARSRRWCGWMVRVVGKEGAFGAGGGESSGMDGSRKIMRMIYMMKK